MTPKNENAFIAFGHRRRPKHCSVWTVSGEIISGSDAWLSYRVRRRARELGQLYRRVEVLWSTNSRKRPIRFIDGKDDSAAMRRKML